MEEAHGYEYTGDPGYSFIPLAETEQRVGWGAVYFLLGVFIAAIIIRRLQVRRERMRRREDLRKHVETAGAKRGLTDPEERRLLDAMQATRASSPETGLVSESYFSRFVGPVLASVHGEETADRIREKLFGGPPVEGGEKSSTFPSTRALDPGRHLHLKVDNIPHAVEAVVSAVDEDGLVCVFPDVDESDLRLSAGDGVHASFEEGDHLLSFLTNVVDAGADVAFACRLEHTDFVLEHHRRASKRIELDGDVRWARVGGDASSDAPRTDASAPARLANISLDGCCLAVESADPAPSDGDLLLLELPIRDADEPVRVVGRVVDVKTTRAGDVHIHLEFTGMGERPRRAVGRALSEHSS